MMNTLEIFHIYNITRLDNQITDKCTVAYNAIFDIIISQKFIQKAFTALALTPCIRFDLCSATNCHISCMHVRDELS